MQNLPYLIFGIVLAAGFSAMGFGLGILYSQLLLERRETRKKQILAIIEDVKRVNVYSEAALSDFNRFMSFHDVSIPLRSV
jgi:hypothetical protein